MQEFNETENKILNAAAQVFLEQGKAGARTQTIAELAGINKALLHYYFRTKEKLYEIVTERIIRKVLGNVLGNLDETQEFETWLPKFIHNYLYTIATNPMASRFMLWELEAGGSRVAQIVREVVNMKSLEDNPFYRIINRAVQEGKIRPVEPEQLIISMIALCVFPFVARPLLEKVIPGLDIRSESFLQSREKAITEMILHGICPA